MRSILGYAFHRRGCFCIGSQVDFRRRPVLLIGNVTGKFADGISNFFETILVKRATLGIDLRELQTLQSDLIIIRRQRPFFQELLGLFGSFRRVAR